MSKIHFHKWELKSYGDCPKGGFTTASYKCKKCGQIRLKTESIELVHQYHTHDGYDIKIYNDGTVSTEEVSP